MAFRVPLSSINASDGNVTYTQGSVLRVGAGGNVNAMSAVTVDNSGVLTCVNLVESSSIAVKENIIPINGALDDVIRLEGVTYDRRDGSSRNEAGLIAEEVHRILPNLVKTNDLGEPYGIHYTKLTAYLLEAIKELKHEIDELKKRI